MRESAKSRAVRAMFNLFPCYRRTGVRVVFISHDFLEVRIRLPLNWKTRGYNGTIFGGSLYASIDPVYMTMIAWNLGKRYIAWDKAASIEFLKPGRSTLHATFRLAQEDIDAIRAELETRDRVERSYDVVLHDSAGVPHATFRKLVQVRKRTQR